MVEFAGQPCSKALVECFASLTSDEKEQLADRFQFSPEEAYLHIMTVLSQKDPDIDRCHTELVFYWEQYITKGQPHS